MISRPKTLISIDVSRQSVDIVRRYTIVVTTVKHVSYSK